MKRLPLMLLLITMVALTLPGCTSSEEEIPVETEFGRMLASVPASFLEERQIWYQDPGTARDEAGFGDVTSIEAFLQLSEAERQAYGNAVSGARIMGALAWDQELAPLVGWDSLMLDRSVFSETPPPPRFTVNEGAFDAALVREKLREQGYEEATHGDQTYYRINGDMEINMTSPISRQVMAALNRVMVTDDILITAPSTDLLTGILDARSGAAPSAADNPAVRALAQDLEEARSAFIMARNLVPFAGISQPELAFDLDAARDWEPLHNYEIAGLAHRKTGEERFLDIGIAYTSADDAKADAGVLRDRLASYQFFSHMGADDPERFGETRFTANFEMSEPVVTDYDDAAVLKISCRFLPDSNRFVGLLMIGTGFDLLFLAPDPAPYLAAADDVINGPDGRVYRADVQQPGMDNPWPPVETTTVQIGGPDTPAQVTYRSMIETKAGQTRNNLITVNLPETLPFGPEVSVLVEGISVPEGITVSQDISKQSCDDDPVSRVTGAVEIGISDSVQPGDYSFRLVINVGNEEYGEVPCTIKVVD